MAATATVCRSRSDVRFGRQYFRIVGGEWVVIRIESNDAFLLQYINRHSLHYGAFAVGRRSCTPGNDCAQLNLMQAHGKTKRKNTQQDNARVLKRQ